MQYNSAKHALEITPKWKEIPYSLKRFLLTDKSYNLKVIANVFKTERRNLKELNKPLFKKLGQQKFDVNLKNFTTNKFIHFKRARRPLMRLSNVNENGVVKINFNKDMNIDRLKALGESKKDKVVLLKGKVLLIKDLIELKIVLKEELEGDPHQVLFSWEIKEVGLKSITI
jgi:hypothetical protein